MNEHEKHYWQLIDELRDMGNELSPWYVIDKIKFSSVYVWTNTNWWGTNVFDICADGIRYYEKDHVIPEEAWPIIHKMQAKLNESMDYVFDHADSFSNGKWLKQVFKKED